MMKNLPNVITVSRILLVVLYTVLLAAVGLLPPVPQEPTGGWFTPLSLPVCLALWAFVVAAITDFFDGYLARKYQVVSDFGKLMDPLADKILVCAAFIYLTWVGLCPFWVSIIIVFREFLVTGLRQIAATKGYVLAADRWGKWKTAWQLTYCISCMVHLAYGANLPEPLCSLSVGLGGHSLRTGSLVLAVLLTLISGLNYCRQMRRFF